MQTYKDQDQQARETHWKTGFIVVQDADGRVYVDGDKANFKNQLERAATIDDAIYMLTSALQEFQTDRMIALLQSRLAAPPASPVSKTDGPAEEPTLSWPDKGA